MSRSFSWARTGGTKQSSSVAWVHRWVAALAFALAMTPLDSRANPVSWDRKLLKLRPLVVELGTLGAAGAMLRFTPKDDAPALAYGITIEHARNGAMVGYRAEF
jgi:hypothetical protein